MAGSNMEVFRFGFYLFFPIFMMYKFGDPVWYEAYVQPYRDPFIPSSEASKKPPQTPAAIQEELAKYRARRQAQSLPATQTSIADEQIPSDTKCSSPSSEYDASVSSSTTLEALAKAEAARRGPVGVVMSDVAGGQDAGLDSETGSGSGRWAWGQNSSNSGRLV